MYEKNGGKRARHAWTDSAKSIGALSYIAVQCFEQIPSRQRRFLAMECAATHTTLFALLPSSMFLCVVPQGSFHWPSPNHPIELNQGPFDDIFQALLMEKDVVSKAVQGLLKPQSHKSYPETDANFHNADD